MKLNCINQSSQERVVVCPASETADVWMEMRIGCQHLAQFAVMQTTIFDELASMRCSFNS